MTLKTLFKRDFNVKTKGHLPISKKRMTKIPLPKKTSLVESLQRFSLTRALQGIFPNGPL